MRKNTEVLLKEYEDSGEFLDPLAPSSIFLAAKIRVYIQTGKTLSENLLEQLSQAFQEEFPKYRLRWYAVKKIWDKVSFYLEAFSERPEAFLETGQLNLEFLIQENLKDSAIPYPAHPYHRAHQIATRISECVAILDGYAIATQKLTKKIWHLQRHLLKNMSSQEMPLTQIDALILKTMAEISAKEPLISSIDLQKKAIAYLLLLKELPCFSNLQTIHTSTCALLSEKLYPISPLHSNLRSLEKETLLSFIQRHYALLKEASHHLPLDDRVRRILALYMLASQLPKNLSNSQIAEATKLCYPVAMGKNGSLPQTLYAFIAAETLLMRGGHFCYSIEHVIILIQKAYQEAIHLPAAHKEILELVEVFIWKTLSDTEKTLDNLPYKMGQRLDQEIADAIIDNPRASFSEVIHKVLQFFRKTKELTDDIPLSELEDKTQEWALQSDMLLTLASFDTDSELFQEIREHFIKQKGLYCHNHTVSSIHQSYLKKHPTLSPYSPQMVIRIEILYKYQWYICEPESSSLDRFLQWHYYHFRSLCPEITMESLYLQILDTAKKRLRAIPPSFFTKWCEQNAQDNEGQA